VDVFRLGALLDAREFRDRTAHDGLGASYDTRERHTGGGGRTIRMVACARRSRQREAAGAGGQDRRDPSRCPAPVGDGEHTRRRQRRDLPEAHPDDRPGAP